MRTLDEVFLEQFLTKNFSRVVKTTFYVYRGPFRWLFLGKTTFLPIIFGRYLQKFVQTLAQIIPQACQNWSLCVQGKKLWEHKFWKKKRFHYYRILSKNLSDFWQENFGRLVKNVIWVYKGTLWGEKQFFGKKICSSCSFLDFEPNCFNTLTEICLQYGCRICILRVQRISLRKKNFEKVISYSIP